MKKTPWYAYENYQKVIVPSSLFQTHFHIKMSVIDGGSFKCYAHDTVFETTNPEMWQEHLKSTEHTESGSTTCVICGNQTEYQHKLVGKRAVCDKCKEDMK